MKKILILLASSCLLVNEIKGFDWGSIKNTFNKTVNTIKDVSNQAISGIKSGAENIFHGAEIAGQKFSSCSQVVGLGTAWVSEKAGLETAKKTVALVQKGTEAWAFEKAKSALQAAKDSSKGTLSLAQAFAKGLNQGLNIKCIRFFGTPDKLEFELIATIFGKEYKIQETASFSNKEDFIKKIYELLKNKALEAGKLVGIKL